MISIRCDHGFFRFNELRAGEAAKLQAIYGFSLAPYGDGFTFDFLKDAPMYSILGKNYLGLPATVTYSGHPWDVMRANGFVYDFTVDKLVDIVDISLQAKLVAAQGYYISDGLLVPGSVMEDGSRVKDYSAWYLFDRQAFRYSEVTVG